MQAIKNGQADRIRDWLPRSELNKYVDFEKRQYKSWDSVVSSYGMTALHYAAFYCQTEIVDILLQAGAGTLYVMGAITTFYT